MPKRSALRYNRDFEPAVYAGDKHDISTGAPNSNYPYWGTQSMMTKEVALKRAQNFIRRVRDNPKHVMNYPRLRKEIKIALATTGYIADTAVSHLNGALGDSEAMQIDNGTLTYDFGDNTTSQLAVDVKPVDTAIKEYEASKDKLKFPKGKTYYKVKPFNLNPGDMFAILDMDYERDYLRIENNKNSTGLLEVFFYSIDNNGDLGLHQDSIQLSPGQVFEPLRRVPINAISIHNATAASTLFGTIITG